MKNKHLFFAILSHLTAIAVVAMFCIANSLPRILADSLPPPQDIFTAMLQGQFISIPLMLFPVILTFVLPGGWPTIRSWFAKPTCSFRYGFLCFILLSACSMALLTALSPSETQPVVAMFQELQGWQILVIACFICVIVPFVEELLFRGVLMRGLPIHIALIYSSVIFALAHGSNIYLIPLFFTGWMFGVIRLRTNSLIIGILYHMAFNTQSLLITLLD